MKQICPFCKQEYEGKHCINTYACVDATSSPEMQALLKKIPEE